MSAKPFVPRVPSLECGTVGQTREVYSGTALSLSQGTETAPCALGQAPSWLGQVRQAGQVEQAGFVPLSRCPIRLGVGQWDKH